MFGGGFPFGGMGGMPFDMPERKKSDSTKYYKLLEVDPSATAADLKKAHRKLAMKHHPDKGGDPQTFQAINQAYDVLKDPEKRKIYDKYGEDAIKEGMSEGGGGGGMDDILGQMFGGGGRSRGPRKADDVGHRLKVSLEELYTGSTRKLALSRNMKCGSCNGSGSKSGVPATCGQCRGQGVEVHLRQIGPGMMQQVQQACRKCSGTGRDIAPGDGCTSCASKGLSSEKKVFEINVEKGMKNGHKIVLHGEAGVGNDPSVEPGNVVFQLETKPHDVFKRVGSDLFMDKEIPLADALCGGKIYISHLDDRKLVIEKNPGEIIKPDQWVCIDEEGMPHHGSPFDKGNLYVRFLVKFPDQLDAAECAKLAAILPPSPQPSAKIAADAEEVSTKEVDIEKEMKTRAAHAKQQAAYNSDSDDEGMGGQRVQCAQQ